MPTTTVPLRQLGKKGPNIPAMGLGLMGLSMSYGPVAADEERFAFLDRALEIGATNWDSSDFYGDSEKLLGRWFERTGKRNKIFLATKFGIVKGSQNFDVDSSPEYVKAACEESLKDLQTDYIDLYYMHRANPNTPIEKTMRAMLELQAEGKIKYIGLSEISSDTLRRACKVGHVDAVQIEYAPFELAIENDSGTNLLSTCRELGVATIAYSPLGRGMLAGALNSKEAISGEGDWRGLFPRFDGDNLQANLKLVDEIKEIAAKKRCTAAQLCIAWVLKQGKDVIPIPGTKKIKYLEENMAALQVQLTDAEEKQIRELASKVAGARVPEFAEAMCFTDTVEEK